MYVRALSTFLSDLYCTDFVNGLQRDFPMTVNTVIRTAGKVLSGHWDTQLPRCPICAGLVLLGHE